MVNSTTQPFKDYFFILSAPRSGSAWLKDTLNIHPDMTCLHEPSNSTFFSRTCRRFLEIFDTDTMGHAGGVEERLLHRLPLRFNYGLEQLDQMFQSTSTRLVGAKIIWSQLFRHMEPADFFTRYREARCIVLYRLSIVDNMCSWTIAKRTRVWNSSFGQHTELSPFTISKERAERYIFQSLFYQQLVLASLRVLAIRHMELSYEDTSWGIRQQPCHR